MEIFLVSIGVDFKATFVVINQLDVKSCILLEGFELTHSQSSILFRLLSDQFCCGHRYLFSSCGVLSPGVSFRDNIRIEESRSYSILKGMFSHCIKEFSLRKPILSHFSNVLTIFCFIIGRKFSWASILKGGFGFVGIFVCNWRFYEAILPSEIARIIEVNVLSFAVVFLVGMHLLSDFQVFLQFNYDPGRRALFIHKSSAFLLPILQRYLFYYHSPLIYYNDWVIIFTSANHSTYD